MTYHREMTARALERPRLSPAIVFGAFLVAVNVASGLITVAMAG